MAGSANGREEGVRCEVGGLAAWNNGKARDESTIESTIGGRRLGVSLTRLACQLVSQWLVGRWSLRKPSIGALLLTSGPLNPYLQLSTSVDELVFLLSTTYLEAWTISAGKSKLHLSNAWISSRLALHVEQYICFLGTESYGEPITRSNIFKHGPGPWV